MERKMALFEELRQNILNLPNLIRWCPPLSEIKGGIPLNEERNPRKFSYLYKKVKSDISCFGFYASIAKIDQTLNTAVFH